MLWCRLRLAANFTLYECLYQKKTVNYLKIFHMNLNELKNKIFEWTDFYGGDIISAEAVRNAKTKKDLADALEEHRSFMEAQLSDAHSHLDNFKKELGLG